MARIATKDHTGSQFKGLTVKQQNAVDLLAAGENDTETAEAVQVDRSTVNRWKNHDPVFIAALNKKRKEIWGVAHDRLRGLVSTALDTLEAAMSEEQDVKAAVEVLKAVNLYGQVNASSGPTDPESALWARARELARKEIDRQPKDPGGMLDDWFDEEAEVSKLAAERVKELKEELGA